MATRRKPNVLFTNQTLKHSGFFATAAAAAAALRGCARKKRVLAFYKWHARSLLAKKGAAALERRRVEKSRVQTSHAFLNTGGHNT